jgi:uncharacterized protein DUF551
MSEWISVNTKLPEEETPVLLYDTGSVSWPISLAWIVSGERFWRKAGGGGAVIPTHWCALPEPPKETE